MDADQFYDRVAVRAELETTEDGESVARATLRTLGERLSAGEADDVAGQLPEELAEVITDREGPEGREPLELSYEEFTERVAERSDVGGDTDRHVQAVSDVLDEVVRDEELESARDQLPGGFTNLFRTAEREDVE